MASRLDDQVADPQLGRVRTRRRLRRRSAQDCLETGEQVVELEWLADEVVGPGFSARIGSRRRLVPLQITIGTLECALSV